MVMLHARHLTTSLKMLSLLRRVTMPAAPGDAVSWTLVDDIVAYLADRSLQDPAAAARLRQHYEQVRATIYPRWKGKAFHRILVACATFGMAWKRAFGKKASAASMAGILEGYDFTAVGIPVDASCITTGSVNRLTLTLERATCPRATMAVRVRSPPVNRHARETAARGPGDDASTAAFLSAPRLARVEHYCVECGETAGTRTLPYTNRAILDVLRKADPFQQGIPLKTCIGLLHDAYLLAPTANPDPRKADAAMYVAAKIMLQPFVDRGLVRIEDKARNKRVWWVSP